VAAEEWLGARPAELNAAFTELATRIGGRAPEHDFDPSLERVRKVLDYLGDPQKAYRIIHITGTNGKTSTARMCESLVRAAGLRTGLFTSPHLSSMTERIVIDGEPISAEQFLAAYDDVSPYIEIVDAESVANGEPRLSFFEVLTVLAYAAFADAPVDVAIIEVGIGGKWDATNVADGDVAVFTPIGLDHQKWLGDSITEIAAEKSGIIKPGATVVRSVQPPDAAAQIDETAAEKRDRILREDQELFVVDRQMGVGGQLLTLQTPAATYADIFLPLHGKHQAHNAVLALAAVEALLGGKNALNPELVGEGFASVKSPGRLEIVKDSPTILVDVAHNPHGAHALCEALGESFNFSNLIGVVGIMADKDIEGFLAELEPQLDAIVLTKNNSPRCADPADIAPIAKDIFGEDRVHIQPKMPDAIAEAVDLAEAGDASGMGTGVGVLVTGSVVTVGEARALLSTAPQGAAQPGRLAYRSMLSGDDDGGGGDDGDFQDLET